MNPWFGRLLLGGVGSAVLGASLLGATATNVFAAQTPSTTPGAAAHRDPSDRRLIAAAVFAGEAAALDMQPADLRAALKDGKKVSDLAAAKGMSKDQFADRLANTVKPALDKLVDAKKITQLQDARTVARIRAGHVPFWNGIHSRKAAA